LLLPMSVRENLSFAALGRVSRGGVVDATRESKLVGEMIDLLEIHTAGTDAPAGSLSGGNQQKVVIAKWLLTDARIMLLNDPTRGIDVGSKSEIYSLMRGLADAGVAILMISSDMEEVIGVSDRIVVMQEGAISGTLNRDQFSEENVMRLAVARGAEQSAA